MEERLTQLEGRKIDVSFGNTAVVRGVVAGVSGGLLFLDDEEGRRAFVAIDKIAFFLEVKDFDKKPGFVSRAE